MTREKRYNSQNEEAVPVEKRFFLLTYRLTVLHFFKKFNFILIIITLIPTF